MGTNLRELGRIGDKKDVASVIEDLFSFPYVEGTYKTEDFYKLFGDYTELILLSGSYFCSETTHGISDPVTHYSYELNEIAVIMLSEINSPISNNILHKLSKIPDKADLIMIDHAMGIRHDDLSFEPIRKLAREELGRRGNPPYRPSDYLVENAYELDISPVAPRIQKEYPVAKTCWFCGKNRAKKEAQIVQKMYGQVRPEIDRSGNLIPKWGKVEIGVPRYSGCQQAHARRNRISGILGVVMVFVPLFICPLTAMLLNYSTVGWVAGIGLGLV